jgi:sulfotransferase
LLARPEETIANVYTWIGLSPHQVDLEKLTVNVNESDSHYRYKYTHRQSDKILSPKQHEIPLRIHDHIHTAFSWYFDWFYPTK